MRRLPSLPAAVSPCFSVGTIPRSTGTPGGAATAATRRRPCATCCCSPKPSPRRYAESMAARTSSRRPATAAELQAALSALADPTHAQEQARVGISGGTERLGIKVPRLRALAKPLQRDNHLADALFDSGVHEARLLAAMVAEPKAVTPEQMDRWAAGFDSWDLCDTFCSEVFCRTPYAWEKVTAWSVRPEEFVRRAAFALVAYLAVHEKQAADERFLALFPLIEAAAADDRNFVRKAVSWALRQTGKRNPALRAAALACAARIAAQGSRSSRWIATDVMKELGSGERGTLPALHAE